MRHTSQHRRRIRSETILPKSHNRKSSTIERLEDRLVLASGATLPILPHLEFAGKGISDLKNQLVFLDFDGDPAVNLDGDIVKSNLQIPPFQLPSHLDGDREFLINAIRRQVEDVFLGAEVEFTNVAPGANETYSTIHIGGTSDSFGETLLGLAENIDLGNLDRSDRGFVFSENHPAATISEFAKQVAKTIAHETGHLLGYVHDEQHAALTHTGSPYDAHAFKPVTHIEIGKDVLADVLPDSKITIDGNDYDVDPAVVTALNDHPEFYNAGVVGPDGFPDIIFGQGTIHPEDTGEWLTHLLNRAWLAQSDPSYSATEKSQILAFSYGFLTHAAGDIWAHTLVNEFAQGPFPAISDVVSNTSDAANAIRHIFVEGAIGDATPGFDGNPDRTPVGADVSDDSTPGVDFDAPTRFIYETLIQPNAGQPSSERGLLIDSFLQLRQKLVELAADPVLGGDVDVTGKITDVDDAEDAADDVDLHCTTLGDEIDSDCEDALEELGIEGEKTLTQDILNLVESNKDSIKRELLRAYIRAWIKDIDSGLEAWGDLGLAVTRALFDPQTRRDLQNADCAFHGPESSLTRGNCEDSIGTLDVIFDEIDPFINDHLLSMMGAPDFVGGLRAKLGEFSEFIRQNITGPLRLSFHPVFETLAELKQSAKDLVAGMVATRFGIDVGDIDDFFRSPSSKLGLESIAFGAIDVFAMTDQQKLDNYMGIPSGSHHPLGAADIVPGFSFHPGAEGGYLDSVTFDKNTFDAYANSVTLSKLLLLNGTELEALYSDLSGIPYDLSLLHINGPQNGNIMTDTLPRVVDDGGRFVDAELWLDSIDEDHQWREDAEPFGSEARGVGNFPLWESCLLRDGFRTVFQDWENGTMQFPDLGDDPTHDPNENAPDVWYFDQPAIFGGTKTLLVNGISSHVVTIETDGSTVWAEWNAAPGYCSDKFELPVSDVDQVLVRGINVANVTQIGSFGSITVDIQATTLPGQIDGKKWNDADADGTVDGGEPGINAWKIQLDTDQSGDQFEPTRFTRPDGTYSFTGLPLGLFDVLEENQDGWEQSFPTGGTHSVNLTAGDPTESNVDFGNFQAADVDWLPTLGAYLDSTLSVRSNPLEIIGFDTSLDDLVNIPFLERNISEIVDFAGLFQEIDRQLYLDTEIPASASPATNNLSSDAHFVVDIDGLSPTEVIVPATVGFNFNVTDLVADLNDALSDAGLDDKVEFDEATGGELVLKSTGPGLMSSLTLATLRLVADSAGPTFGQLAAIDGPIDPFTVKVTRETVDSGGSPSTSTEAYSFKIGAEPPTGSEMFVHTQDNVTLEDLAGDLNDGFASIQLYDVIALVDSSSKIVLAAANPNITKIEIDGMTGDRLGFSNNQSVDDASNNDPAKTDLMFSGGHDTAARAFDSIKEMLPLVEAAVIGLSDPALPGTYSINPVYDVENETVEFDLRVNHRFTEPIELDTFEHGLDLGSLGTLELAAEIDANATIPSQLDLRVGIFLGERSTSFKLREKTKLSFLNGENGVRLSVGTVATDEVPTNGQPGTDITFTIEWLEETGLQEQEFTLYAASPALITTFDNVDAASLVSDFNELLRQEALADTFRASLQTTTVKDAMDQVTATEERLILTAIDADVRSFSIKGDDIDLLGFDANEHHSNFDDLLITIGSPGPSDDDCSDDICSFTVNLDGAIMVEDIINKIEEKAGSSGPAVDVEISDDFLSLILEAQGTLIVSTAETPTEITETPSTTTVNDGIRSLASVDLGIIGISDSPDPAGTPFILEGDSLDGATVQDRIYIVERDASSVDKNLRLGVGLQAASIDASAAFGQIGIEFGGNADLSVDIGSNFRDPGRKWFSGEPEDGKIYLSEPFNIPPEVIVMDPSDFDLGYFAGGTLEITPVFDAGSNDFLKAITGLLTPTVTVTATADSVNKRFDFDVDPGFADVFTQLKNLTVTDIVDLFVLFLESLESDGSTSATSGPSALDDFTANLPFASESLDQAAQIAETLKSAFDSIISEIDLGAVQDAIDDVETAVWNLGLPLDEREDLLGSVDMLKRAIGNPDDVDATGTPRLAGRLLSATRRLIKAVNDDVESLVTPPSGKDALVDAKDKLKEVVPSLNSIEELINAVVEQALSDALGISPSEVEFDFGFIDNINPSGDRALAVGLTIDKDTVISKSFVPEMPISDSFGPFAYEVDPGPFDLHAGGKFGIGIGVNLDSKEGLLLVDPPATFDGVTLHKSEIDLNVGFEGFFNAEGSFGNLDVVEVDADLFLLESEIDAFDAIDFGDGVVELTNEPFHQTDSRFIVVAVLETQVDGSVEAEVLRAEEEYTLVDNGGTYEVHLLVPATYATADRVTVEYFDTDPAGLDASDVNDRASVKLDLEPTVAITNFIGAVPFADLGDDTRFRLDAQGTDTFGNPTHGSLIVGSADPRLLNSQVDDAVTVAASMQHLFQPQVHFDEDALTELLEGVDFNLKTILLGIEAFLETLEDGLTSEVMTKLPVIGSNVDTAATFIGKLRTEFLEPFIDVLCDAGGDFAAVEIVIETWIFDQLGPSGVNILGDRDLNTIIDVNDVVVTLDQDHFEIEFKLAGQDIMEVDFDSGLDGLKIDATGSGGVEMGWQYEVDFGVGIARDEGFYFIVNSEVDENAPVDPEFSIGIFAGLAVDTSGPEPLPTSIGVNLFGLQLTATDNNDGVNPGTQISGMLTLDLKDLGPDDDHLQISDFSNAKFGEIFEADLTATVAIDIHLDAGISSNLPSVEADVVLDWMANVGNTPEGGIEVSASGLDFSIMDIGINLGDFLSKHVGKALDTVDRYIEPIKPVIELLKTKVPGVSQASELAGKGEVTFLDMAFSTNPEKGEQAKKFVDAIDLIIGLIDSLKSVDESDKVSFILLDELSIIDSTETGGTDGGLTDPNWKNANMVEEAAEDAEPNSTQNATSKIQDILQKIEELGINLHILEPKNLVNVILGRQFDVISYELPRFELPFTWEQGFRPIPVFPPFLLRIGLDASIFADLSVGYDSRGIDTGNFFDGFYFGDREDVFVGPDIEEFGLGVGVRLAALLDVGVASGGVEGELRADIFANWRDTDDDGKLYLDEIVSIVKQDGIECLFDLRGEFRAIVRLVWSVFGFDGDKEIIDALLFSFQNTCPKFELGHVVEGTVGTTTPGPGAVSQPGTLVVHAGPFAGERRVGNTSDVAEEVTLTQLSPGVIKVEMLGLERRYSGVSHIYFDGGNQNDSLILVDVDMAVTAIGGAGDDNLHGSAYADYIDGGAGSDTIIARGSGDEIFGGSGNDIIYADLGPNESPSTWGADGDDDVEAGSGDDLIVAAGGGDFVDAGSGNDEVYGHTNGDISLTVGVDLADELHGGIGNDIIYGAAGNDMLFGDGGHDEIYGEADDDTIEGGPGNDLAMGDAGSDEIHAGSGNDVVSGGLLGDLLFGDDGADLIVGGLLTSNSDLKAIFKAAYGVDDNFVSMIEAMETVGTDDADELWGGRGGDLLVGDSGGDQLLGGWGDDSIIAHQILDPTTTDIEYIEGGPNNDFICGAHGQDEIYGGTSLIGLAHILADESGPAVAGGFTMTSCDTAPVVIEPPEPASISGVKFNDLNENGIRDASEQGLEGWTINLLDIDGEIVDSQVTDDDGEYTFFGVDPGSYRVVEQAQDAWEQTSPGGVQLQDLAIHPVTGVAFAISESTLFSVDLESNLATPIAPLGIGDQAMMAFGSDGTLYTMGYGDPNLYAIDLGTGAATTILNTGQTADGGLTYSAINDVLYLSNGSSLVEIDPVSGTVTTVGAHGVSGIIAIRIGESGNLYGIDVNLNLYQIDTNFGVAVPSTSSLTSVDLEGLPIDEVSTVEDVSDNGYEFTILAGQTATDIDFGNRFQGAEISGRKFHDLNGDGVRTTNEPYLNGYGIEIYDSLGQLFSSVLTDDWDIDENGVIDPESEKGWYRFTDLTPDDYTVTEVPRPDWIQSQPALADADVFRPIVDDGYTQTRSDALVTGLSGNITEVELALNIRHESVSELEAYLLSPAGTRIDLFDAVGFDGDHFTNTTFDDDATFDIDDSANVFAPFSGSYRPMDLLSLLDGEDPNGTWTLVLEDTLEENGGRLDDWSLTISTDAPTTQSFDGGSPNPFNSARVLHYDVTVGPDEIRDDLNFGNYEVAEITGLKFGDINGNRRLDPNESGLQGFTIYADLNDNGQLDRGEPNTISQADNPSTEADEEGRFTLTNLPPGNYNIRELVTNGYRQTFPVSSVDSFLPAAHAVQLHSGQSVAEILFGNQPLGSIHGTKYEDIDGDGVQDPNEPGLAGVTVYVDLNGNREFDRDEPSAITMSDDPDTRSDEAGMYWLENLPFGDYNVHEVVPNGQQQVSGGSATVYENDFENNPPINNEWSHTTVDVAVDANTRYLGPFENQDVTLTLNGLPAHNEIQVEFDLYILGSWDGYGGPGLGDADRWKLDVVGGGALIDTTFANVETLPDPVPLPLPPTGFVPDQAYPGGYTVDFNDPQTGADSVDSLGYFEMADSVYRISTSFSHAANLLQLRFSANGLEVNADTRSELWGIDNIRITVPADHHEVTVDSLDPIEHVDFGNQSEGGGAIHGQKWIDIDGDGKRSDREHGLDGWEIVLLDAHGNIVATQTTMSMDLNGDGQIDPQNESGLYWFEGVRPGNYVVEEIQIPGWQQTFPATVPRVVPGDSNGDLTVNSSDLIQVFSGGKYENNQPASFSQGDWNADGFFTTADLILLFTQGVYERGAYADRGQNSYSVTIDGQTVTGLDFGNTPVDQGFGEIHGTKWFDENANGRREATERGMPDVLIFVDVNANGVLDPGEPNTTTMQDGMYWLTDIPAGHVTIGEVVPIDFRQTFPANGFHHVMLNAGQVIDGVDFGNAIGDPAMPVPGAAVFAHGVDNHSSIRGSKWQDNDGDGVFDRGESLLPDVTIYLDLNNNGRLDFSLNADGERILEPSAVTGQRGEYAFTDLAPGEYVVREVIPDGFVQTFPAGQSFSHFVGLGSEQDVTGVNFGNMNSGAALHGRKWNDLDGDGVRDSDEPPLAGVTIYLDLNFNGQLDSTVDPAGNLVSEPSIVTNENGEYWFMDLPAGEYMIREVVPAGFTQTFPAGDSFAHFVGVGLGQEIEGLNFGNHRGQDEASIHGIKFLDLFRPFGERDSNREPGLAGVTIYVDLNNNGRLDAGEPSTVTMSDDTATPEDETGRYWLTGLPPGVHTLREVIPANMIQTFPPEGGHLVDLAVGQTMDGIDFGNRPQPQTPNSSIHGVKFLDSQPFGEWDPAVEPGIEGVTIYLDINRNGQLDAGEPTTVTMENGMYWFSDVPPGTYTVREVVPFGFEQTFPAEGGTVVDLKEGTTIEGVNFGNRPVDARGSIHGFKWLDSLDPLSEFNDGEPGLAGVTIYLDLNNNGQLDVGEPSTKTMEDDPATDEDETGQYWFMNVPPGEYVVREVVPAGFVQSYPGGEFLVSPLRFVGTANSTVGDITYLLHENGQLSQFDSGVIPIGNVNFTVVEGDIDFDPTNGVLYALSSGANPELHRLDLANDPVSGDTVLSSTTLIGALPLSDPSAMAFDDIGNLMLLDITPSGVQAVRVDKTNASILDSKSISLPGTFTALGLDYESLSQTHTIATPSGFYQFDYDTNTVDLIESHSISNLSGVEITNNRYHVVQVGEEAVTGIDFANFEPEYLPDGDDLVFGQNDSDLIYGDNFVNDPRIISTGSRSDSLNGEGGADNLFGQEEQDVLSGGVDGTAADDSLDGGLGIDRVFQVVDNSQTLTNSQLVGEGTDSLISIEHGTLVGGGSNNTLDASGFLLGSVILRGEAGHDTLIGTAFGDDLDGGFGNDFLDGRDGNDTYRFGDTELLVPLETDTLTESTTGGMDTLDFSATVSGVLIDLTSTTIAQHPQVGPLRTVVVSTAGEQGNLEHIVGSPLDDDITGNAADNIILAGDGVDTVASLAGNDTIDLGAGIGQSAAGGADDDLFIFQNNWGSSTLIESAGDGNDTIDLSAIDVPLTIDIGSIQVSDGTNTITHPLNEIENIISGSKNDEFIFADGANLPNGGSIVAGNGTDHLDFSAYTTPVMVDLLASSMTAASSTVAISEFENVTGGSAGDTIGGDVGPNRLIGGPGGDTLGGRPGDDEIFGGLGDDTIGGGAGADTLHGNEGNDSINGGAGDDTFIMVDGDGFDTINEAAAGGFDQLDLTAITGDLTVGVSGIVDVDLTAGGNLVDADNQIETILLGTGDDRLEFSDAATLPGTIDAGDGTNTIDYSLYTSGVIIDLAAGTSTGTAGISRFVNATGGSANDLITGDADDNVLAGNSGDDTIFAGLGNDTLLGGSATTQNNLHGEAGHDTYVLFDSSLTDVLHEGSGYVSGGFATSGGTDTIDLSNLTGNVTLDLTLSTTQSVKVLGPDLQLDMPEHFENVLGTDNGTNTLIGNDADNRLIGGAFNDTIKGGLGDDILVGLANIDDLQGEAGNDIVLGGDGNDAMLWGGIGRDIIIGGLGQDAIDGQAGDDILVSGATNFDAPVDYDALEAFLLEWISSSKSYGTRVNNLTNGVGPLNIYALDDGITVNDDLALDTVVGGLDDDLYFVDSPDVSDELPGEIVFARPTDHIDRIAAAIAIAVERKKARVAE